MDRPTVAAAILAAMALLPAACAADEQPDTPVSDDQTVGHIHGLGIDPADDSLYVATHHGLFHIDGAGTPERVADRWQDTMAFTVVGPGHFLASGHPDLREELPPHLGLIESTDGGESWTPLALQGEADFHILEPAGAVLYAYDATTGRLLRTEDRRTFDEVLTAPLISVAATRANGPVFATTGKGKVVSIDTATGETTSLGGPVLVHLDGAADGTLAGIGPDGVVHVSADNGGTWQEAGSIGGQPAAFTITDQGWYAATQDAVVGSRDEGRTWSPLL